jgi:hypothetical protein
MKRRKILAIICAVTVALAMSAGTASVFAADNSGTGLLKPLNITQPSYSSLTGAAKKMKYRKTIVFKTVKRGSQSRLWVRGVYSKILKSDFGIRSEYYPYIKMTKTGSGSQASLCMKGWFRFVSSYREDNLKLNKFTISSKGGKMTFTSTYDQKRMKKKGIYIIDSNWNAVLNNSDSLSTEKINKLIRILGYKTKVRIDGDNGAYSYTYLKSTSRSQWQKFFRDYKKLLAMFTTTDTLPVITQQPADVVTSVVNDEFAFSVSATGPDLRYQWYCDGEAIPGATGSTFSGVVDDYTEDDVYYSGDEFYCQVYNDAGAVKSSVAVIQENDEY